MSTLKSLIMKYPYILSKNEETINIFFKEMNNHGIPDEEALKYLFECPRLISFDI